MNTTLSYQEKLVRFLKKEVGGANLSNHQVKDFSTTLKELDMIDMSKTESARWLISEAEGQAVLTTLVTWYSLGLLQKMNDIKTIIKGK